MIDLHFEYEPALEEKPARELAEAMRECLAMAVSWEGVLFRSTKPGYASESDLLKGLGAYLMGGRFNLPGTFPVVYASTNDETAGAEVRHYASQYGWKALLPRVLAGVEVRFVRLLDLREGSPARKRLGVTAGVLLEEWEPIMASKKEAKTQMIGRLAYAVGFEGLLAPSARCTGTNLNFFPDLVEPELSSVRIINPHELPPQRKVDKPKSP